jgi:hypothetical protein
MPKVKTKKPPRWQTGLQNRPPRKEYLPLPEQASGGKNSQKGFCQKPKTAAPAPDQLTHFFFGTDPRPLAPITRVPRVFLDTRRKGSEEECTEVGDEYVVNKTKVWYISSISKNSGSKDMVHWTSRPLYGSSTATSVVLKAAQKTQAKHTMQRLKNLRSAFKVSRQTTTTTTVTTSLLSRVQLFDTLHPQRWEKGNYNRRLNCPYGNRRECRGPGGKSDISLRCPRCDSVRDKLSSVSDADAKRLCIDWDATKLSNVWEREKSMAKKLHPRKRSSRKRSSATASFSHKKQRQEWQRRHAAALARRQARGTIQSWAKPILAALALRQEEQRQRLAFAKRQEAALAKQQEAAASLALRQEEQRKELAEVQKQQKEEMQRRQLWREQREKEMQRRQLWEAQQLANEDVKQERKTAAAAAASSSMTLMHNNWRLSAGSWAQEDVVAALTLRVDAMKSAVENAHNTGSFVVASTAIHSVRTIIQRCPLFLKTTVDKCTAEIFHANKLLKLNIAEG